MKGCVVNGNKINWPAVKARRAFKLRIEDNWRWWQEPDALQEKGAIEPITPAGRATTHALMVWADDGGGGSLSR